MENHIDNNIQMDAIRSILSQLLDSKLKPIQQKLEDIENCMHERTYHHDTDFKHNFGSCEKFQPDSEKREQQGENDKLENTSPNQKRERSSWQLFVNPGSESVTTTSPSGNLKDSKLVPMPDERGETIEKAPLLRKKPDDSGRKLAGIPAPLRRHMSDDSDKRLGRVPEHLSDPIEYMGMTWEEDEAAGSRGTVKESEIVQEQVPVVRRDRCHDKHPDSKWPESERIPSILSPPQGKNQSANTFKYHALDLHIKPDATYFKSVTNEVKAIVEQIGKGLNMELVYAGSSFEGLNVGYPYEFDIQLAVKDKFTFRKVQKAVKVIDQRDKELTPVMMREHISEMLPKVIAKIELPAGWSLFLNSTTQALHTHQKGFTVALELKKHNKTEGILLDLIPCIKLPLEFVKQNFEMSVPIDEIGVTKESSFYAVYQSKSTWRISASVIEHNILKEADDEMKLGLRAVKYFIQMFMVDGNTRFTAQGTDATARSEQNYGLTSLVPSYFLKNAFLKTYLDDKKGKSSLSCDDIVQILLANIESSYSENNSELKKSRHFLFNEQSLNLMEIPNNRRKICSDVQEIKQHLNSGCDVAASVYPLKNYPQRTLHSLKK